MLRPNRYKCKDDRSHFIVDVYCNNTDNHNFITFGVCVYTGFCSSSYSIVIIKIYLLNQSLLILDKEYQCATRRECFTVHEALCYSGYFERGRKIPFENV